MTCGESGTTTGSPVRVPPSKSALGASMEKGLTPCKSPALKKIKMEEMLQMLFHPLFKIWNRCRVFRIRPTKKHNIVWKRNPKLHILGWHLIYIYTYMYIDGKVIFSFSYIYIYV